MSSRRGITETVCQRLTAERSSSSLFLHSKYIFTYYLFGLSHFNTHTGLKYWLTHLLLWSLKHSRSDDSDDQITDWLLWIRPVSCVFCCCTRTLVLHNFLSVYGLYLHRVQSEKHRLFSPVQNKYSRWHETVSGESCSGVSLSARAGWWGRPQSGLSILVNMSFRNAHIDIKVLSVWTCYTWFHQSF